MKIIVARCGFNRNSKKEILYGPLSLGGAGFRHLYVLQGISQTLMFIRNWRQDSTAGRLLRIAIAWFQEQTGVSYSILEKVHAPLPQLESKWINSLRQFLGSINTSLHLDKPTIPPVQRLYDAHIMDIIQNSNQFSASEIRRLNYCRLYLRVVLIEPRFLRRSANPAKKSCNVSTNSKNLRRASKLITPATQIFGCVGVMGSKGSE